MRLHPLFQIGLDKSLQLLTPILRRNCLDLCFQLRIQRQSHRVSLKLAVHVTPVQRIFRRENVVRHMGKRQDPEDAHYYEEAEETTEFVDQAIFDEKSAHFLPKHN